MISIEAAIAHVLEHARPKSPTTTPVDRALGLVLAEDVVSDIDSPPHDKAMVDGYAVQAADFSSQPVELQITEEITAGEVPSKPVVNGTAARIMTGAPIPTGADAVVMVERTEIVDDAGAGNRVRIDDPSIKSNMNIMRRGTSLRRDEVVLRNGHAIRAVEVGLLSEVGRCEIATRPAASVAVLATGNELVAASEKPNAGQIRNSNGPMLCSLVDQTGGRPVDLGVGRDDESELRKLVEAGLKEDILVLSGGVSAGVLDLVPKVLQECGVQEVFHKVQLKPGKPIWFGVREDDNSTKLVFGLPGNPVSSLVCFELFVRPAIDRLMGRTDRPICEEQAFLTEDHHQRGNRATFHPSRMKYDGQQKLVQPLKWHGSADMRTLADANCLAFFPPGDQLFCKGDVIQFRSL